MARRTKEIAGEAASRGVVTVGERVRRLRAGLSPILQTAGAAAGSYYLASVGLGHEQPFFAAVAAMASLGAARGQHWRRAIEMVLGVSVGIAVADAIILGVGNGSLQIFLVATLAMSAAVLLGGGSLLVTQACVSAILVATIEHPSGGLVPDRFFDALVGGGVALLVSQLFFPLNPLSEVRRAARPVFTALGEALDETAAALRAGAPDQAREALVQARAIDEGVRRFNDALGAAYETARLAPPRRRSRGPLEIYAQAASQLDLAVRNTRVLSRASISLVRDGTPAPPELSRAIGELAGAVRSLGEQLKEPDREVRTRKLALRAARTATSLLPEREALAINVVIGQVRLTASDLLRGSGMDLAQAQEALDRVSLDDED